MGRPELEGLLKVTNRAIEILVVWKISYIESGQKSKNPGRIESVNSWIAELAEFKIELKNLLKGNGDWSISEKFHFLLEQIEKSEDRDTKKLYIDKLAKLTKGFLTDGLLEVMNDKH